MLHCQAARSSNKGQRHLLRLLLVVGQMGRISSSSRTQTRSSRANGPDSRCQSLTQDNNSRDLLLLPRPPALLLLLLPQPMPMRPCKSQQALLLVVVVVSTRPVSLMMRSARLVV